MIVLQKFVIMGGEILPLESRESCANGRDGHVLEHQVHHTFGCHGDN